MSSKKAPAPLKSLESVLKTCELILNIGSFSVNNMYAAGNSRFGKSGDAKEWTYRAYKELNNYGAEMEQMRNFFDESKHAYAVHLEWFFTRDKLITKKGILSSRAHDLSNVEKNILDVLFLPVNATHCENLNVDDRYLAELSSRKSISEHSYPYVKVRIEIVPLNSIPNFDLQ